MSLDAPVCQSFCFPSHSTGKGLFYPLSHPTSSILHPETCSQPLCSPSCSLILVPPVLPLSATPCPAPLLTLACSSLRVGLLVMQALAVHRDAAVAVQLFSLGWGCLVHRSAVGSLLVLLAAVPPGAGAQAPSQPEEPHGHRGRGSVLWCVSTRGLVGAGP